jgi:tetratricopeptide (TPR) repeat protein
MTADVAPVADARPKAKIFISYSRKDMAFADRLEAALKTRGFEPLIDRTEIYAFEDWWRRIEGLIGQADTIVFVVSPDAVASEVALKEIAHAASLNKRFAPIICRRTDDGAVPEALRRLNFIFFDDAEHFEASADRLAEALNTDIGWVRQHTEYGEAARRWAADGRKSGLLLRSPVLEEAERWIASRPRGAPEPTKDAQAFVAESRRGATKRRNILTGSLAAGLVIALVLAGLAYWQRELAVQQRQIADQQRKRAEDTLAAATKTASSLVFDLAQRFRNTVGIPANLIKDILDRARGLQEQLIKSGQVTPDLQHSEAAALDETTVALLSIGDTTGALAAVDQARQIFAELVANSPKNTGWQRDLWLAYIYTGEVQVARGELTGALKSDRDGLAIIERVTISDPGNAQWQSDLSDSYRYIGEVLAAQSDLAGALKSYRDSFAIADRIAKADPANAAWQRELSVAYNKVGSVLSAQGDLAGALKSYGDSLAIIERLAKSAPTNAMWQIDLSVAYQEIGDVQKAQGNLAGALKSYLDDLGVPDRPAKADPGNADQQRRLWVALNKVGDVQILQGDVADALKRYRDGISIISRLAQSDPRNTGWQRDLSISDEHIGDVEIRQGDSAGALKSYNDALAVTERLAQSDRSNAQLQFDVSLSLFKVGFAHLKQGDRCGRAEILPRRPSHPATPRLARRQQRRLEGCSTKGHRLFWFARVYQRLGPRFRDGFGSR